MALIWHEGYDRYDVIGDLQLKADRLDASGADIAFSTSAGAFGGGTFIGVDDQQIGINRAWYEISFPRVETPDDLFFAAWVKLEAWIRRPIIQFLPTYKASANNDPILEIWMSHDGSFIFNSAGLVERNIAQDNAPNIKEDSWFYLEARIRPTDATGQFELRINGVTIYNDTVDMAAGQSQDISRIGLLGGANNSFEIFWDDIIIYDSTGTDAFTTFLGPKRIYTLSPNGAGLTTNGTAVGVANNWDAVNDSGAHDTTTYVNIGTTTNLDLYTYENLPETVTTIDSVLVSTVARTDGATPRQIRALARENVTTGNGTTRNVNFGADTDYHLQVEQFDDNPDTATAWTDTEVNAAQFGWELVT